MQLVHTSGTAPALQSASICLYITYFNTHITMMRWQISSAIIAFFFVIFPLPLLLFTAKVRQYMQKMFQSLWWCEYKKFDTYFMFIFFTLMSSISFIFFVVSQICFISVFDSFASFRTFGGTLFHGFYWWRLVSIIWVSKTRTKKLKCMR